MKPLATICLIGLVAAAIYNDVESLAANDPAIAQWVTIDVICGVLVAVGIWKPE